MFDLILAIINANHTLINNFFCCLKLCFLFYLKFTQAEKHSKLFTLKLETVFWFFIFPDPVSFLFFSPLILFLLSPCNDLQWNICHHDAVLQSLTEMAPASEKCLHCREDRGLVTKKNGQMQGKWNRRQKLLIFPLMSRWHFTVIKKSWFLIEALTSQECLTVKKPL